MILTIAICCYIAAITAANLLVGAFGPWVSPLNALVLIGFDLTMRDWLHVRLRTWQMGALIFAAGALAYLLNPASARIAVASACAFTLAALADWGVFRWTAGSWLRRANVSNGASAAVDSLVFPTAAFGVLMPEIILLQFAAKVIGGASWAWVFDRFQQRRAA